MRIIGRGQENDPAQGKRMDDKTASRILRSNAKGKDVASDKLQTAKKASRDHYAHEADKARRGK